MVKFQSYLAGSAFALLLGANIAMELLHANPGSEYLWHINIYFAREVRPLFQHIDGMAGGSSAATILSLGGLAVLCIAAAGGRMWLLATANCHIALGMFIFLTAHSYTRTYPHGLPATDTLASLAAEVSLVQFGMVAFLLALSGVCVLSHARILSRAFGFRGRRSAADARLMPLITDEFAR